MKPSLQVLTPEAWRDYILLDSGGGAKLERFGRYVLARPEPQAIWPRGLAEREWERADASYALGENGRGEWSFRREIQEPWPVRYRELTLLARCTPFRHTGIFPDQAVLWDWLAERAAGRTDMRVLNLFGYTGAASLAAAGAGAQVTHVDASKAALLWGKENQAASGLETRPIRWLQDDVFKFVRRELRRGNQYDGILLDPPPYGHGKEGETWRFFEGLPELVELCRKLLSERAEFVLVTAFAIVGSALLLQNMLAGLAAERGGEVEAGELAVHELSAGRLLATAHFARWTREGT